MTATLEELNGLQRKLLVSIPQEAIDGSVKKALREKQKTTRHSGFRPGKIPMNMIESMYGREIFDNILNEKVNKAFSEQVKKDEVTVASILKMEMVNDTPENEQQNEQKDIKIEITFEIFPEINLDEINGKDVEKITCTVNDDNVESTIEILRQQRVRYEDIDRPAQKGDRVIIDFTGSVDGEKFEGGSAENYPLILGNGQMLADFDNGIHGMKPGEEKDITVHFPEEYHEKSLAGKDAIFTIKLHSIGEPHLPEVNEEFARAMGIEDGDVAKMRTEIKKNLSREIKRRAEGLTKNNVLEKLVEHTHFEVPSSLVEQEIEQLRQDARQYFLSQGLEESKLPEISADMFKEQALQKAKIGLLFRDILMKYDNLYATDEQIKQAIAELAENYENSKEFIKSTSKDKEACNRISASITEQNIIDLLLTKFNVTEKAISYEEIIQIQ